MERMDYIRTSDLKDKMKRQKLKNQLICIFIELISFRKQQRIERIYKWDYQFGFASGCRKERFTEREGERVDDGTQRKALQNEHNNSFVDKLSLQRFTFFV